MKLKRHWDMKYGCFGVLTLNDGTELFTVEQNYQDNKKGISSVPPGTYSLVPHLSTRYGNTVALVNPDLNVYHYEQGDNSRSVILIHSANTFDQLEGCIAPGLDLGILNSKLAVTSSRKAMGILRKHFDTDKILTIE